MNMEYESYNHIHMNHKYVLYQYTDKKYDSYSYRQIHQFTICTGPPSYSSTVRTATLLESYY